MNKFSTRQEFANFMSSEIWGRARVRSLNKTTWDIRLENLVRDCERQSSDTIEFEWNAVAYGLVRAVVTSRVNPATDLAIRKLKVRQLCELLYLLRAKFDTNIESYAGYLMRFDFENFREGINR